MTSQAKKIKHDPDDDQAAPGRSSVDLPVVMALAPWQASAIYNPFMHFCMFGGVATGKTYTGAHFAIHHIEHFPHLTGFVGANTYDQLSQASLMELFTWLDAYGYEYVIDRRPPLHWGPRKRLKKYHNVLSVRSHGRVVTIFTRVLGKGNSLRGITFSWYWLDETRDTPENTHDVVLARLRETDRSTGIRYMKGLVTTTTNGEDWCFKRFTPVLGDMTYGSMHVATEASVKCNIISMDYYRAMLKSYSPQMARQELLAQHVNVAGKPAYSSYGPHNHAMSSPFTKDKRLVSPYLPIVVGLDFNVNPMAWTLGQHKGGTFYFFDEIVIKDTNTPECAPELAQRIRDLIDSGQLKTKLHVILVGDATGESRNTKATESDYQIIIAALNARDITWENRTPDSNPPVKSRVNTMNVRLKAADGTVSLWFHPVNCKKLKRDLEKVVVKEGSQYMLDQVKDKSLTHSSDGVGYLVCVLAPLPEQYEVGGLRIIHR